MALFYTHPVLRTTLYVLTWMSAVALLGLAASRLKTTHDIANTHESIVAELLVASILAVLWIPVGIFHVLSPVRSRTELIPLFILWIMYLIGASIATNDWPTRTICNLETIGCNILIPMIAMAWVGFGLLTLLIFLRLLHSATGHSAVAGNNVARGNTTGGVHLPTRERAVV